jgi:hypothetical protein
VDVHRRHDDQTLALVGVCVNRIGTPNTKRLRRTARGYRQVSPGKGIVSELK